MKIMDVKISQKTNIRWSELRDIQGNVKTIDNVALEKMKESLRKNGFCDPFIYWVNPLNKEKICIAGNQRLKALKEMKKDGDNIPDLLPALPVKAESESEAKKILLSLASTFGQVNQDDLTQFIETSELDPIEIDSMTNFIEVETLENKEVEIKDEKKSDGYIEYLKLPYTSDDIELVKANLEIAKKRLEKETGVQSESDVVAHLLIEYIKE